ncbi:MAG: 30S ribosome-binding factor RbfA [Erysipelotrichaceae bacterium]|nr:30S ribosome-binding factor RbfA [Erysipelotrichaceae bacterium]MBQ9987712.1 30S ribosome-binding factor RbfA [Erysipelotrichales bacterium]MBR3693997.1 30S ribosome-binding factor RbfA [Erysipelotrichales bacterium]
MSIKQERVAGIIRKEISELIQFNLKDPQIGFVTITDVALTADLSIAKVYVTFLGKDARNEAGLKALNRSKGYLRSELAKRLSIRKCPELIFLHDDALEKGNRIEKILFNINQEQKEREERLAAEDKGE